ncbi:MAG: AI-2E family transporter [Bacteroidia bacterium]
MPHLSILPFSAKLSFSLIALIASAFIIYIGQDIIVPLILSALFAIILQPFVHFLKNKIRIPLVIGAIVTVFILVALIIGLLVFISFQVSDIITDIDKIQKNLNIHIANIQHFIRVNFNISWYEQKIFIDEATKDSIENGKELIGVTITSFSNTILNVILVPIYTFLILLYGAHFKLFLKKLLLKKHHTILSDILKQIKSTVKSYIVGLILELVFVSALTSLGLYIIGVEYAIVLGLITGILNLIPYIGILFAGLLTIIASLTGSADLSIVVGIIVVNVIVQFIDNNLLVPLVVSSKVKINAISTIVGILIGGALAGISGMFLAIPIMAIVKVIFDRIDYLEPWGYLLGDDLPKTHQWKRLNLPKLDFDDLNETETNKNSAT